jgi:hypothetical protein
MVASDTGDDTPTLRLLGHVLGQSRPSHPLLLLTDLTRANNIARIRELFGVPRIPIGPSGPPPQKPEQPKAPECLRASCADRMRTIVTLSLVNPTQARSAEHQVRHLFGR